VELLGDLVGWFTDAASWQGEDGLVHRTWEHVTMCALALLTAMAISLPAGLVLGHTGRGGALVVNIANLGRAVPSFAILVVAAMVFGIGSTPAFLALVALAIPPMVTNTMTAIQGVDPEVREAARGMGLTGRQVLTRVEVPMGMPLIMAGVRTSGVQIVATASLAAIVGWGGLGRYVVDGLATRDFVEVSAGALSIAVLSILTEVSLALAQRALVPTGLRARAAEAAEEEGLVPLAPGART
jgi:osmoprotectant transport system permease protein